MGVTEGGGIGKNVLFHRTVLLDGANPATRASSGFINLTSL
jgi:ribosome-associated protein YbcJ (S4-like RNA binding protein)